MFSIGEVAGITGISRDRLRYYEEKGILNPDKNIYNGYREYGIDDIDTVLLIEFYRSIDLSIDSISRISGNSPLEQIKHLIDTKKQAVDEELGKLTRLSEDLSSFLSDFEKIKNNLNEISVRRMEDFQIYDELADFRSYSEFSKIHASRKKDPGKSIIRRLTRKLLLEDNRIVDSRMIITGPVKEGLNTETLSICRPGECLYSVREDSRKADSLMADIQRDFLTFIHEHNLVITGEAYANMLFIARDEGFIKSYLEIFLPLKK